MLSWTHVHEQWLRTEFPSHSSFDFSRVHTYPATHGGTLFELGGACPVHKRVHKSNHWTLWVKEMDDGRFSYKVGCFDDNTSSRKRSFGGASSAAKAKTFSFKGFQPNAVFHSLEDDHYYILNNDGVIQQLTTTTHEGESIDFQGFYPHVLSVKPLSRFTKDGFYIRWEGDLSTVDVDNN